MGQGQDKRWMLFRESVIYKFVSKDRDINYFLLVKHAIYLRRLLM